MQIVTGNEIPSSLAAMKTFLQPLVDNGFCDAIGYDDDANPTKLLLYKDDAVAVRLLFAATRKWGFEVPNAGGSMHAVPASIETTKVGLCSGGVIFFNPSYIYFAIAKTKEEKIGVVCAEDRGYSSQYSYPFYTTCVGDNTSLALYTNGYKIYRNSDSGDRTILTPLPVVGTTGSSDYFSTVFVKNIVQWAEDGVQLIGGKQYGCIGPFAMLDE